MRSLGEMPDERQQLVLDFISVLQTQALPAEGPPPPMNPGLEWDRGLLVFTGDMVLEDPLKFQREQHLNDIMRRALGC